MWYLLCGRCGGGGGGRDGGGFGGSGRSCGGRGGGSGGWSSRWEHVPDILYVRNVGILQRVWDGSKELSNLVVCT